MVEVLDLMGRLEIRQIGLATQMYADDNTGRLVANNGTDKPEIKYVIPKEGSDLWVDSIVITKASKNPEAAHKFIDFMVSPEFYVKWDTDVGAPASANAKANAQLPADAMNRSTANALLKTLEEPAADTLFLMVSNEPLRLLPTIRSRCQVVPVNVPPAAVSEAALAAGRVRPNARAPRSASPARGPARGTSTCRARW